MIQLLQSHDEKTAHKALFPKHGRSLSSWKGMEMNSVQFLLGGSDTFRKLSAYPWVQKATTFGSDAVISKIATSFPWLARTSGATYECYSAWQQWMCTNGASSIRSQFCSGKDDTSSVGKAKVQYTMMRAWAYNRDYFIHSHLPGIPSDKNPERCLIKFSVREATGYDGLLDSRGHPLDWSQFGRQKVEAEWCAATGLNCPDGEVSEGERERGKGRGRDHLLTVLFVPPPPHPTIGDPREWLHLLQPA